MRVWLTLSLHAKEVLANFRSPQDPVVLEACYSRISDAYEITTRCTSKGICFHSGVASSDMLEETHLGLVDSENQIPCKSSEDFPV